jgi:hypothetical protein
MGQCERVAVSNKWRAVSSELGVVAIATLGCETERWSEADAVLRVQSENL